ncbi:MAG: carboxypeptidase-like regulatory domain-containing protein [Planctomycetota bacterium]
MRSTSAIFLATFFALNLNSPSLYSSEPASLAKFDHLTINQWIQSDENGNVRGQLFLPAPNGQLQVVSSIDVGLLGANGKMIRSKSDERGRFTFSNVAEGVYAFSARGNGCFAACAMHVVESQSSGLSTSAEIAMAAIDYTSIESAMTRYLPPSVEASKLADLANVDLGQLEGKVVGSPESLFRVAQSKDGVRGRLHVAGSADGELPNASLTNVFLFQNSMEIDRDVTNEEGEFVFEDLEPGLYSLLAIGTEGIGLMGFELIDPSEEIVDADSTASISNGEEQLVGLFGLFDGHKKRKCKPTDCCEAVEMQIAPCAEACCVVESVCEVPCVEEVIIEDPCCGEEIITEGIVTEEVIADGFYGDPLGTGFAGGYGGGYGGGGGGGYGGFGGLGGLAALAVIPALTDDDNDAVSAPVVSSPVVPN